MRVDASPVRVELDRVVLQALDAYRPNALLRFVSRLAAAPSEGPRLRAAELVYCPYYLCHMMAEFRRPFMAPRRMTMLAAMDGYRGDAGLAYGVPQLEQTHVDEGRMLPIRYDQESAVDRMLRASGRQLALKYHSPPEISALETKVMWRPAWVMALQHPGRSLPSFRWVDAESGVTVYRYDSLWDQLSPQVRALSQMCLVSGQAK